MSPWCDIAPYVSLPNYDIERCNDIMVRCESHCATASHISCLRVWPNHACERIARYLTVVGPTAPRFLDKGSEQYPGQVLGRHIPCPGYGTNTYVGDGHMPGIPPSQFMSEGLAHTCLCKYGQVLDSSKTNCPSFSRQR